MSCGEEVEVGFDGEDDRIGAGVSSSDHQTLVAPALWSVASHHNLRERGRERERARPWRARVTEISVCELSGKSE